MAEPGSVHARSRAGAPRAGAGGFTLIEMLMALLILAVGVTTLLLALGDSMSVRRGTDARLLAAQAVADFVHRVQATGLQRRADAQSDLDIELAPTAAATVEGFPGVRLQATMEQDADQPFVWLLRIRATWAERGEEASEEFLRVLPRQLPLGARIQRFRDDPANKR